jgi:two-component system response regulator NreC
MRSRLEEITPRELQVLRLIAKGRTRNEIADELFLSPLTVDNHRKSLMRKLGIHDRVDLARFAIAEGLVEV